MSAARLRTVLRPGALALALALGGVAPHAALAADDGARTQTPAAPDGAPNRGPGASGAGDGSGMGQDTSERGQPRGTSDKPVGPKGPDGVPTTVAPNAPKACDDGRQPVNGSCEN